MCASRASAWREIDAVVHQNDEGIIPRKSAGLTTSTAGCPSPINPGPAEVSARRVQCHVRHRCHPGLHSSSRIPRRSVGTHGNCQQDRSGSSLGKSTHGNVRRAPDSNRGSSAIEAATRTQRIYVFIALPINPTLFGPQRGERINAGRAPRRQARRDDRDHYHDYRRAAEHGDVAGANEIEHRRKDS